MKTALCFFLGAASLAAAADTLFLSNGSTRSGRNLQMEGALYLLEVELPPPPDRPHLPPVKARVTVRRDEVDRIEFGADRGLEAAIAGGNLTALESLWTRWQPWLQIARSPAPRVAVAYANALLASPMPDAAKALEIFQTVERSAWDQDARALARQGRLRAMIAQGRADEAVEEANELAKISEDPALLIEARYIQAKAADARLRKLIEENPRWEEDVFVIPERHRLYNEALDLYLFPYLFFGSESAEAARGLWGATEIYRFTGELEHARELARDLVALYPATPEAKQAAAFIESLPEDIRAADPEAEAREDQSPPTTHENNPS